ncbi:MAG: hypothetical protein Q8O91_08160 [Candidatus Aminicenantes bacterium]|nr:hypothetical protein [Candidatus Aminicenantes bacterium]
MRRVVMLLTLSAIIVIAAGIAISASSGTPGTTSSQVVPAPIVETYQLTFAGANQNYRHPAVAEDSKGNRLVIFRGPEGNKYYYVYCEKGGTWSSPKSIGSQPSLVRSLYAYIHVDSTDRFHCEWEHANGAVYASFRDGIWTTPFKIPSIGVYDQTSGMAVRSDDEVVTVDCEVLGYSKDIWVHAKGKNETQFRAQKNLTRDPAEGSTQPHLAVDSKDNIWVVWKSDYHLPGVEENLVIYLAPFDKNYNDGDIDWLVVSSNPGWAFLPQVAVNSEDKVMAAWAQSTSGQYLSRLYDPATKKLGPMVSLDIGLCRNPWHTFFSKLTDRGKDFYIAAISPARILYLLKFDEATSRWIPVAQVSDRPVEMMSIYSGYDRMLVAWNSWEEPSNVFLTAVEVEPLGPPQSTLTVQSSSGGTTSPAPGSYKYDRGSSVSVSAIADAAYGFTSWSGDASGNSNPITFTLDRDMTVKANFTLQQTLTIQAGAGGTTDPSPGSYRYNKGSSVSIRPLPDAAYRFISWSGDASGESSPLTVTLDRDMTVKANFRLRVQSPINLKVEKKIERGFFSGYYLNVLSWEANPQNSEHGVVIAAQRIYRKLPTESYPQWTLLAEVAPGILTYVDRNVPRTSGYVYAVTCVDANGYESSIY